MAASSAYPGVPQFRLKRMMAAVAMIALLLAITGPLTRPRPRTPPPPAVKIVPIPPFETYRILPDPSPRGRLVDGDDAMVIEPPAGNDLIAVPPRAEEPEP
jgi:hypothetical protein